jgi:uncharacterized membrane protein YgcG
MMTFGLLALGAILGSGTPASAADVVDRAGFFSPEGVAAGKAELSALQARTGWSLQVETFPTLPADQEAKFAKLTKTEQTAFFGRWLRDVATSTQATGVVVLICREPAHLEVGTSQALKGAGYSAASRQALSTTLLTHFRAKEYDQGLAAVTSLVTEQLTALKGAKPSATPVARQTPVKETTTPVTSDALLPTAGGAAAVSGELGGMSGSILSWVILGAVVLGGIMLVSMVLRAFTGGMGAGLGGGGIFGGLLAGLGGAMMGSWLYDQFAGNQAWGGESTTGADGGATDAGAADTGWDTSGGDFGGGDFGGGDFSGGDF